MQGDPALSKYSHIILDEIHERDTLCDFVLTILRDVALKVRSAFEYLNEFTIARGDFILLIFSAK